MQSRECSHAGCAKLVFSQDYCHLHNGSSQIVEVVPNKPKLITLNSCRTISISKDGTTKRAYKQCTHEGCSNIAKKHGKCYSHGAPRKVCSAEGCNSKAQKLGLCMKHQPPKDDEIGVRDTK